MENFYNTLNIPEDAGNEDIKTAFRLLAKQWHPDTSKGDSEKFSMPTGFWLTRNPAKIMTEP